jgi:hypothetical protein
VHLSESPIFQNYCLQNNIISKNADGTLNVSRLNVSDLMYKCSTHKDEWKLNEKAIEILKDLGDTNRRNYLANLILVSENTIIDEIYDILQKHIKVDEITANKLKNDEKRKWEEYIIAFLFSRKSLQIKLLKNDLKTDDFVTNIAKIFSDDDVKNITEKHIKELKNQGDLTTSQASRKLEAEIIDRMNSIITSKNEVILN